MWISEPMPVMTRIITDDSGSSRSVNAAVKSPDVIQVKTWLDDRARLGRAGRRAATPPTSDTSERRRASRAQATAPDAAF